MDARNAARACVACTPLRRAEGACAAHHPQRSSHARPDMRAHQVGWDESYARKVRLITGCIGLVLLFCGIVCQWWAGNNFADVPLSTLCKSFSGMPDVMEREDFFNGKKSYYERVGENGPPITLQMVANQFVGENYDDAHPVDQFLYSNPSFWCKYLPACPPGAKCQATPGHGMTIVEREPWVRAGWVGRKVSENPSWAQATGVQSFTSTRIRCHDKATVYKRMLEAVFTDMKGNWVTDAKSGARWSQVWLRERRGRRERRERRDTREKRKRREKREEREKGEQIKDREERE